MKYYFYGVIINICFLLFLRLTTYIGVDIIQNKYTDAKEYVGYAENFINTGTFYYDNKVDFKPGVRRSIGFPFCLSLFMWVFGNEWVFAFQLFNCFLFALLYLIIPAIIKELFDVERPKMMFWFLLLTGVTWCRIPQVLSDTWFTVCLFTSIYVGIRAIKSNNWYEYVLYILVVSFTTTIRFNIAWFFIFNLLLFVYLKGNHKWAVITTILLVFTCNFNTFRNIYNHDLPRATNNGNLALLYCFCRDISGNPPIFTGDIKTVLKSQDKYVVNTVVAHPVKAVAVVLKNTKNVFLDNHPVNNVAQLYVYNWKDYHEYKKSWVAWVLYWGYMLFYFLFGVITLMILYTVIKQKDWVILGMVGFFFIFWVAPSLLIGVGGARLRMDYELWMLIMLFLPIKTEEIA